MSTERYLRFRIMPDGSLMMCLCVKSPYQAGMSFFYRQPTDLERMGYEIALKNEEASMLLAG
jgi:hypothetical protein